MSYFLSIFPRMEVISYNNILSIETFMQYSFDAENIYYINESIKTISFRSYCFQSLQQHRVTYEKSIQIMGKPLL